MKVLDLPDEQDNPIRQILLKQDDNTLVELSKKSKQEIKNFLLNERKNELILETSNNNEKFNRLKSAFSQSILDKNPKIAKMLEEKNFDGLLGFLKS
jgi:predicted HAD superfamily phosphohydrolase YqeG